MLRELDEAQSEYPWPYIKSENISIGNPQNNIAITTLWSRREKVTKNLSPKSFAIAGQLYAYEGINIALRNLLANPNIRYLVVCGTDLSKTGQALVNLWQQGVTNDRSIAEMPKAKIDDLIPLESLAKLISEVQLIDAREIPEGELSDGLPLIVSNLDHLPARLNAEYFPLPEVKNAERKPSFQGTETVIGETVGITWLKLVQHIMEFGEIIPTNYGNMAKDVTNLVAVITDEPEEPRLYDFFNFTPEDVNRFLNAFTNGEPNLNVFYTYGNRLQHWGEHNVNQTEIIERKLKKDPHDRGAIGFFYDPYRDNQLTADTIGVDPKDFRNPCDVLLQARIVDNKLMVTSYFRSNDMYGAWPRDAFALRKWQYEMANKLRVQVGPLVTISSSAHIYSESWPAVQNLLKENKNKLKGFDQDPRGNFRITVENGNIIVRHQDEYGKALSEDIVWSGIRPKASIGIANLLTHDLQVGTIAHAFDIGRELLKAELCAKLGIPYIQDSDSIIEEIVRRLQP